MQIKKKYELMEDEYITSDDGCKLYRIRYLIDIPSQHIKAGDIGGYVESEFNLSQEGNSWIEDDAIVMGGSAD